MPSNWRSTLLTAVRVVIVTAGFAVTAATMLKLASMPPPRGDGFAHGMAGFFGGVIILASLGVATVAVVLPTLLGRDDPLGFNRWQRLALKAAGALVGGGVAVGLAYGLVAELLSGLVLLLMATFLAAVVVGATLVWRLAEAVVRLASRSLARDAS